MIKPRLILKPSVTNALAPELVRRLVYGSLAWVFLFGITITLKTRGILSSAYTLYLTIITLLVVLIPLSIRLITLSNTKYLFYDDRVISEFDFIKIRRHSVPYSQVVNLVVEISLWDRLCRAGDIVLHTAEESESLVLKFIKDPKKIEAGLYRLMRKS